MVIFKALWWIIKLPFKVLWFILKNFQPKSFDWRNGG